ncbi:MAG: SusC/RagA family TonB-linked outer membrane protein [Bacteroidaceae bacterium]|nr:SusC/RagA family TonB-linked outer membrane protein [Bacteroidaceae bacterium]
MQRFMQLSVALIALLPSVVHASETISDGYAANDSVKVEAKAVQASDVRTITGAVYDAATNTPLAGVRVQATGHKRVTAMTNADGKYKLNIPSYVTLLNFSTEGYMLVQKAVGGADVVNVRLYDNSFSANYSDDVVLAAERGFSDEDSWSLSVDADIQNKLGADVRAITRSGSPAVGAVMFIRGLNSLNANTQPLFVIDGVIWDMQEGNEAIHMGFYNNVLNAIDVNDIRDVKVIKNGTAIYGARGANGVVIINTKRGESMATRITANIYANVALAPTTQTMMGAEEYRVYANDLIGTMDVSANRNIPFLRADEDFIYYKKFHNNTDWASLIYREALTQNYKVNVEGGDDVAMYNFSFGYTTADSPLKSNNFNRLNIRLNSDILLADNFTTRFDITYSRVGRELLDDGLREDPTAFPVSSLGALAAVKSPFLSPYRYATTGEISSIYDVADSYAFDITKAAGITYPNNSLYNPITILTKGSGTQKNELEYTNMGITVAPKLVLGDFKITETFNYSLHRVSEKYYLPYATPSDNDYYHFYVASLGGKIGNYVSSLFGKETAISSDTRVDWNKVFGAHSFDVFGGFRYTSFNFDSNSIGGANTGNDNNFNVGTNLDHLENHGDNNVWSNMSWYLSADYSFRTRYFLQLAASLETSSRFGVNAADALKMCGVAWGFFPSVQAAWLVSSESWFNVKPINMLKLRAGYDIAGNDAIDYFAARSYLQAVKFYDSSMGLQLGNVENDGVKWEKTARVNVGLDAMLFDNRLGISFDWYTSKTSDLLVQKQYQYVTGMGTYWANGGELKNSGFEATVNAKLINTKNWQWELGASVGHYKNEITALDEAIDPVTVYGGEVATIVGESIGSFWGYKTDGVIASTEEANALGLFQRDATGAKEYFKAGDMKFVDVNPGNDPGCIDENDKVIIGNPNPDFYGNIYTRLKYKNLQLDINCNYSVGNDVYNYYRQQLENGSNFYNQTTAMLNRWTVDGQKTDIPSIAYGDPVGNSRFSDRWIEDGSYFKVKAIKLSYDIPVTADWLQGFSVWCAAENVLTFTGYKGNDPEFSVNNNVLYQGVDAGLLPQTRRFHLGLKINL